MKKTVLFYVLMGMTVLAFAHGVNVDVSQQSPFIVVRAAYSGGIVLSGALVRIERPGEDKKEFQSGRMDISGCFVFKPDKPGEWVIVIDDEKGHRKKAMVSLDEVFFSPSPKEQPVVPEPEIIEKKVPFVPLYMKVLLGLAFILGITGLFYGVKARSGKK
jgi:nickel transport protein